MNRPWVINRGPNSSRIGCTKFFKDVPNFVKDVINFVIDVPNFVNDIPRLPRLIPRWGTTSNNFPRVSKGINEPWKGR